MNQNKTLKSEEDWKKELNEAQYTILRKKKGPKDLIQANITCISKMEFTIVQVANHHCLKAKQNLTQAVDGQVLMLPSKEMLAMF